MHDPIPVLPLDKQAILTPLLIQPHRHYHNIVHVNDCLSELYQWDARSKNLWSVGWGIHYAIWFHDIIYNPYAPHGLNEEQSASVFLSNTNQGHPEDWKQSVATAIRETARHITTNDYSNHDASTKTIIEVMLDIDLAQMGHSLVTFSKNSLNIRREYHRTSDMDVVKGRLKFFKELNKRDTFYYTDYFRDLYHTQSKSNVKKEIDVLEECVERDEAIYYFDHLYEHVVDMP